jgi:LPS export ABC transporter ATP-binding protein
MTPDTMAAEVLDRLDGTEPWTRRALVAALRVADAEGRISPPVLLQELKASAAQQQPPLDGVDGGEAMSRFKAAINELISRRLLVLPDQEASEPTLWLAGPLGCAPADRDRLLQRLETHVRGSEPLPGSGDAPATANGSGPDPALEAPAADVRRGPHGSSLSASGLVKSYRKRRVVNEVDVQVSQGEIVGLLGPNGAGKTTTFYMMVGLIPPDAGRVRMDDEDLTRIPMFRRARRGIGYLAQEPSVFRKLSVEENILAILQMLKLPRRERHDRLERMLDELGIKHLRKTKAYALSGGERRRLEITRALVAEPKFMLLDEPFAGVDPIAVHDIQQIVADLRRRGIGVLISDHNVEQTLDIVDRAYIMYDGRVRVAGTVSELVWNDEAAEIYLGPTLTARMRQRYPHPG